MGETMAEIIHTTDSNFESDVSDSDKLVIVDLWAEWCGPCKMIEPIIEDIANQYEGKIKIVKLDVDANQETPIKYGVMNIPTLLFFKNGKEVNRVIGAYPKNHLMKIVEEYL